MSTPAFTITLAGDLLPFGVDADRLATFTDERLTAAGEPVEPFWLGELPVRDLSDIIEAAQEAGAITTDPRIEILIQHADEHDAAYLAVSIRLRGSAQSHLLFTGRWHNLADWRDTALTDEKQIFAIDTRVVGHANELIGGTR